MRFNISWLIKSNFKWLYQIIGKVHWCIIFCSFTMELYLSIKRIIWTVVIFFIFRSFSIQLKLNRWRDGCEPNKKEKTQSLSTESIPHVFTQSHVVIICGNLVCTWHMAWLLDNTRERERTRAGCLDLDKKHNTDPLWIKTLFRQEGLVFEKVYCVVLMLLKRQESFVFVKS